MPTWLPFLFLDYKYIIIALLTIPEGPIIMAISGMLVRTDVLLLWPAYFALVIGDLAADIIWYFLGAKGGLKVAHSKFGKFMGLNDKNIQMIEKYFHKYHTSILFTSKLTTGFGFAPVVLFTAGLTRIPFRKYLLLNLFGGFVWVGFLLALGYSFSHLFLTIQDINGKIVLIGTFVLLILIVFRIIKHFNRSITDGRVLNK